MFEGPEYEPYRKLCRELGLEFDVGNEPVLKGSWFEAGPGDVFLAGESDPDAGEAYPTEKAVLLPRLDQILAMLEEAGVDDIVIRRTRSGYLAANRTDTGQGEGPTREQALLRLFCAVTGRVVTA